MSVNLRGYQLRMRQGAREKWDAGAACVMMTTATGGGKSATMASTIANDCMLRGRGIVQAHRAELVGQLSEALAKEGVMHDIVASKPVQRKIIEHHLRKFGRSYYSPRAEWSVESVDTAIKREPRKGIGYVVQDEGHHVLFANKWGRAIQPYPDAKILLATATSGRADGKGLGAHSDGMVNALVEGPGLGQLMAEGYLVTYEILAPTASDLDLQGVDIGPSGEFNKVALSQAVKSSKKIIGDAVGHYREHAWGKLCIVFAVDIEHARDLLTAYCNAGIPAELVTGEDLTGARTDALDRFARRETWVLINVDLFGEGTDVPGVEVVQMCRPTASFPLFCQQVGRMLRLNISDYLQSIWDTLQVYERLYQISISNKPKALLIDHVGNVYREYRICGQTYIGPPEGFTSWADGLDGKRKRNSDGAIPERICTKCFVSFPRIYSSCPSCDAAVDPPDNVSRGTVEHVDGALEWYSPELLAKMRAAVAWVDGPPRLPESLTGVARAGAIKQWLARQEGQHFLRDAIAYWAGRHSAKGDDSVLHRLFFHRFGIDVLGAMALPAAAAEKLMGKINADI